MCTWVRLMAEGGLATPVTFSVLLTAVNVMVGTTDSLGEVIEIAFVSLATGPY